MEGESSRKICKYGSTIFTDGEQKVALRIEGELSDVLAMRERKGIGFVTSRISSVRSQSNFKNVSEHLLDEVKASDAITDRRQETGSVWGEEEVSLAVYCSQQVRELSPKLSSNAWIGGGKTHTLKSVFMAAPSS